MDVGALHGGMLNAHEVVVRSECRRTGFYLEELREQAVLRECTATKCVEHGAYVCAQGAPVDAEGCSFQHNGGCGIRATKGAIVVMRGCRSTQNKAQV